MKPVKFSALKDGIVLVIMFLCLATVCLLPFIGEIALLLSK
jgi:hypothetical protein